MWHDLMIRQCMRRMVFMQQGEVLSGQSSRLCIAHMNISFLHWINSQPTWSNPQVCSSVCCGYQFRLITVAVWWLGNRKAVWALKIILKHCSYSKHFLRILWSALWAQNKLGLLERKMTNICFTMMIMCNLTVAQGRIEFMLTGRLIVCYEFSKGKEF